MKLRMECRGYASPPRDGNWRFYIGSDDGSKISVDGKEIVSFWRTGGYSERSGTFNAMAGNEYMIFV